MKTVKVRIAVAVDPKGYWKAIGWPDLKDDEAAGYAAKLCDRGEVVSFVTAELPIPEAVEVAEQVEEAT